MIEITGNDIKQLSDSDLRTLIGLLCESELRVNNLPTAGITWGGNQDAKDGGADVRVELSSTLSEDSFIPRMRTCFQVKKPDMPRKSIIDEMRPKGNLRPIIKGLADAGGAYIIISSQSSTSDSALKNRKEAMKEALFDYPTASNIKLDFYDCERIAGWVRNHPSLIIWVRDKIGRAIQGWRPYGNWSNSPGGVKEEYLLDGHIRIHNGVNVNSEGLSAIDGINELRNMLQEPASSVRLTGLSGVGKTRLLQALFDERIGERPLNQSNVFYTDINDSPNPDPGNFTERITALQKPAIIVIDNCPPDLHRRLTKLCKNTLVSLITVEYDVREDQPEETKVFRLEPASDEIIEKVILNRFKHISKVDARTIAEFSGGNARIAIALGNTIQQGESIANLRDNELFIRLFQQRNPQDNSLLRAAEACSLVYSFDSQTVEGSDIELRLLGSLAGMSVSEIYQNVSELKRRDLVQQRGIWRAVLPHAIANKLAQRAFENIPLNNICDVFEKGGSKRLWKSFSRRVSYLHECDAAISIAKGWLSEDGLLRDISNLNELGINLFINIAPIVPELTLQAIERVLESESSQRFFSRENDYYIQFTRLLRSLAYDKELFERSVEILCLFALSESPQENSNSIRDLLKSLFYLYLSGTHATPEQRLSIISKLIKSNNQEKSDLGFKLLSAALEAWNFSSYHGFEFGARSRDYGFSPKNREDVKYWYKLFIEYIATLAVSESLVSQKAKILLAEKFRGLWIKAGMFDELDNAAQKICSKGAWNEGWLAVKTTIRFDGKNMSPELLSRLNNLASRLKPTTLIQLARLYAFSGHYSSLDLVDIVEGQNEETIDEYHEVEKIARDLGREVSTKDKIFKKLLPDIFRKEGHRLYSFGQGLAEGCVNPKKMWMDFCEQLSSIEESDRHYQALIGFLNGISKRDMNIAEEFLDEAVTNTELACVYPWLQTSFQINNQGMERLKRSLKLGIAPIWQYVNIAYGRVHEAINDIELCELLKLISSKQNGAEVSIEILTMRLHNKIESDSLSDTIINFGQELILMYQFSREGNRASRIDYELSCIIKACFKGKTAENNAKALCRKLTEALANYHIFYMDCDHILNALAKIQPVAFLEVFLGGNVNPNHWTRKIFSQIDETLANPMSYIDENLVINWCEDNPKARYPIVASAIQPYRIYGSNNSLEWTPLARRILENSSDPIKILNKFRISFRPTSWSGSRADIMQKRLSLLIDLKNHEDSSIADWACNEEKILKKEISSVREQELKWEADRNERFE